MIIILKKWLANERTKDIHKNTGILLLQNSDSSKIDLERITEYNTKFQ